MCDEYGDDTASGDVNIRQVTHLSMMVVMMMTMVKWMMTSSVSLKGFNGSWQLVAELLLLGILPYHR